MSSPTPAFAGANTAQVEDLIAFSLESLPKMQLTDGSFCYHREAGDAGTHGRSLRYTLMVQLGLLRATQSGRAVPFDLTAIDARLQAELDNPELEPGDYGLYLWADARMGGRRGGDLAERLERSLSANGGLPARLGMELGWIVTGLAHHVATAPSEAGTRALRAAADRLLVGNLTPAGLFRHMGAGRRRRFPNFATQIYGVLACAVLGRHGLDERALGAGQRVADRLLELQLPDGGWPWLFDAERGTVVERYEVYSVHQDAMAPMGMFELTEATGADRYAEAAVRGLDWIFAHNERKADMVDRENHLVLRSIRRKPPTDRLALASRTGASLAGLPTPDGVAKLTELNPTDRPYHFGWVLEAWCGRPTAS